MHPIESIKARLKGFMLNHYDMTSYARDFKKYRNLHNGESCFVLGNGPSLSPDDLTKLWDKNIPCFSANRIYKMFNNTKWRPTYYVCTDYLLIRDFLDEANKIPAKRKFTSLHNHYNLDITLDNCTYFNYIYPRGIDEFEFNLDGTKCMYWAGTVTNCMIQLAIHMGFRNIYLIGVDHNFDRYIDENGNEVIDTTVKNYFCEKYDDDIIEEVHRDLGQSTRGYRKMAKFAKDNDINIYNATRGGKLEEFERVSFEEAMTRIESKIR